MPQAIHPWTNAMHDWLEFWSNFGGYQSQKWPKWWFISKSNLCIFKKSKQNNTTALNFKRPMTCWYFLENFPQTLHLAELRYASMEGAGDFLGFLSTIVPPICPLTLFLAISLGEVGREVALNIHETWVKFDEHFAPICTLKGVSSSRSSCRRKTQCHSCAVQKKGVGSSVL